MKLIKTMVVGVLGTATLLPALPAWAESDMAPTAGMASKAAPAAPSAMPQAKAPVAATPSTAASDGTAAPTERSANRAVSGDVSMGDDAGNWAAFRSRNRKAFLDARIAALHAGLELTPSQDALWPPVEQAIRALSAIHAEMRSERRRSRMMAEDGAAPVDGTAKLKARGAHLIAMGQAMGKLADASAPLLRALDADQKQRLPILLHGLKPHRAMALAFDTRPEFGRRWHHRFAREEMDRRSQAFGGHGDGGGWNPRDTRYGDRDDGPRGGGFGWGHHHGGGGEHMDD